MSSTSSRQQIAPQHQWYMTPFVAQELRASLGAFVVERGAMLGGNRAQRLITHIYIDHSLDRTAVSYSPDTDALMAVLRNDWSLRGVELLGFAHSHPHGFTRLSLGDKEYARAIMSTSPHLDMLLLPIVQSAASSPQYALHPHAVLRTASGLEFSTVSLLVLPNDDVKPASVFAHREPPPPAKPPLPTTSPTEIFKRVTAAYDLNRLQQCRIVAAGSGGASAFFEDMARCGVGEFVLIDPDTFAASNVATQAASLDALGRPKVEVVAERLRLINPQLQAIALQHPLDDLDDAAMQALLCEPLQSGGARPLVTVLCGFTDSFHAQARVNRLALQFGVPSLCAQVYAEGRGAELTFTHPKVTPACHRCILGPRYDAYLEEEFVNTVGSAAAPIFSTTRLNAAKGPLVMALLHHGTNHPRWGKLLSRLGNRNLVQLRLDPDLEFPVFARTFGANKRRVFYDEAVWISRKTVKVRPGQRACPDCGGSGKLANAQGTFRDTRIMRN